MLDDIGAACCSFHRSKLGLSLQFSTPFWLLPDHFMEEMEEDWHSLEQLSYSDTKNLMSVAQTYHTPPTQTRRKIRETTHIYTAQA